MRRAFISHTSELDPNDRNHSFVLEVTQAANSVDYTTVSMRDFPASPYPPASECRERIGRCDLVIFLIGFKRGTLVPGTSRSYVEFEFETAGELNLPRLVFMLSEAAVLPLYMGQEVDPRAARSQAKFRAHLHSNAGLTIKSFSTQAELSNTVKDALRTVQSTATASAHLHNLDPGREAALKPAPQYVPSVGIPRLLRSSFALAAGFAAIAIAGALAVQAFTRDYVRLSNDPKRFPIATAPESRPTWTSYSLPSSDVVQGLPPEIRNCSVVYMLNCQISSGAPPE